MYSLQTLSQRLLPLAATLALTACGGGGNNAVQTPDSGAPDATLNGGQVVNTIAAPVNIKDVAVQADGKIVLVGTRTDLTEKAIVVMRLNQDGTPDNSFQGNGQLSFHVLDALSPSEDHGEAVAIQADGKIVVGGWSRSPGGVATYVLLRLNAADGQLDTSFGPSNTGIALESDEPFFARHLRDIAIQPDGKIVVSGVILARSGGSDDMYVTRFEADGTESADFLGSPGALISFNNVATNMPYYESNESVQLDAAGNILVSGFVTDDGSSNPRVIAIRLLPTGFADTSYGVTGGGATLVDVGENDKSLAAVANPNGKLLLVGVREDGGDLDALTMLLDDAGVLDTAFATNGIREFPGATLQSAVAVSLSGTQAYVLSTSGTFGARDFVLMRINADGTTDTSFGDQGSVLINFGGDDRARAIALAPDGKIVVAGTSNVSGQDDAVVSRLYP